MESSPSRSEPPQRVISKLEKVSWQVTMIFNLGLAGYPTFKRQVLNGQQSCDLIEGLEANDLLFYTYVLTGYIGSVLFLDTILEVINKLRSINPSLTYVCDLVMGNEGKLYVPEELVHVYRDMVVLLACMLTPNQFEAEKLTGLRYLRNLQFLASEMLKLDKQQFLGESTCALSKIITNPTRIKTLDLKRKEGFAPHRLTIESLSFILRSPLLQKLQRTLFGGIKDFRAWNPNPCV